VDAGSSCARASGQNAKANAAASSLARFRSSQFTASHPGRCAMGTAPRWDRADPDRKSHSRAGTRHGERCGRILAVPRCPEHPPDPLPQPLRRGEASGEASLEAAAFPAWLFGDFQISSIDLEPDVDERGCFGERVAAGIQHRQFGWGGEDFPRGNLAVGLRAHCKTHL